MNIKEYRFKIKNCINKIFNKFPKNIDNKILTINQERQLGTREIKHKYYDKNIKKFIVIESIDSKEKIIKFKRFIDFYKYLDTNINDSDLYDYDFKNIDLSKFNITGAYINSKILIKQKLYDDSFYSINIKDYTDIKLVSFDERESSELETNLHKYDFEYNLNDNSRRIYYISDIHLNHKLLKKFPNHATREEVTNYIERLVKNMINTAINKSEDYFPSVLDYLLIGGDISSSIEISEIFYTEVRKCWNKNIVVILGNHELWNYNQDKKDSNNLNEILKKYRDLFNNLNINFLHNELFILIRGKPFIISEEDLLNINKKELQNICSKSSLTILGGLGFSGYNNEFNALSGLYGKTISTLEEDLEQANKFNSIYKKIKNYLSDICIIIFTHTPKSDWSNDGYNKKWIYLNGHTHRNYYCCDDEKTIYADNQIGYYKNSINLKYFKVLRSYDIFKYFDDDIHQISREQYLEFNYGIGIRLKFNNTEGSIWMLKRQGIYCFIFENPDINKIYLLNGGVINKLEHNDIKYYFNEMIYYSEFINQTLSSYNTMLKNISNSIKSIGGAGEIHGCIVDIDYYNHVYLNPLDGTITPYFALSMTEKYIYSNIKTLLLEQKKDLYNNFKKLSNNKSQDIALLNIQKNINIIETSIFSSDTDIYKASRVMKSFQYLTDVNVIRIWDDKVIQEYKKKLLE